MSTSRRNYPPVAPVEASTQAYTAGGDLRGNFFAELFNSHFVDAFTFGGFFGDKLFSLLGVRQGEQGNELCLIQIRIQMRFSKTFSTSHKILCHAVFQLKIIVKPRLPFTVSDKTFCLDKSFADFDNILRGSLGKKIMRHAIAADANNQKIYPLGGL